MSESNNSSPDRSEKSRWPLVILSLLGGILIGGALLLVGQTFLHGRGFGSEGASGGGVPASTPGPLSPPLNLSPSFRQMVEEQIGTGLHLSAAQIQPELQAHPEEDLMSVAKTQGLALDRVVLIATNALQTASDQMVATGQWTQPQSDANMHFWRQQQPWPLVAEMTRWFRGQTG